MASEYLKKKYQDVKPDEPLVLTKKQKVENWWYYHKIQVLIGIVALVTVGFFVRDVVTNVKPDYQIAYVGSAPLTEAETAQIVSAFEEFGKDVNGDGKVKIALSTYCGLSDDPMAYAENIKLTAELTGGMNQIFLLEDPLEFQERYGVLMQKDGSAFSEGDAPENCLCYQVQNCPALQSLQKFDTLYLARRNSREEDEAAISALWDLITAGAANAQEVEE